ncbi:MAG: cytochrome C [Verrucomicrobiia bacterium]
MPFFEFYCPDNNKIYTFFARTREQAETIPACPDNPSFRMVKMMSRFAIGRPVSVSGFAGGQEAPGETGELGGDVDERRMMSVMQEMEQAMASMDEENPDPKLLGRMMRKMADASGERLDGEMEEVVRKLEEGTDPEALEAEFGDLMGDPEDQDGGGFGGSGFGRGPTRDPNVYDY